MAESSLSRSTIRVVLLSGLLAIVSTFSLEAQTKHIIDPATVRTVQRALMKLGHDPGPVDGKVSPSTRDALRAFQEDNALRTTGTINDRTLQALGITLDHDNVIQKKAKEAARATSKHAKTVGRTTADGARATARGAETVARKTAAGTRRASDEIRNVLGLGASDTAIHRRIKTHLDEDQVVDSSSTHISVKSGVATLTFTGLTQEEKDRVVTIARRVKAVKDVIVKE